MLENDEFNIGSLEDMDHVAFEIPLLKWSDKELIYVETEQPVL